MFNQLYKLVDCSKHLRDEGETHSTGDDAGALLENIVHVQFLTFLNFCETVLLSVDRAQKVIQERGIAFVDVLTILQSVLNWREDDIEDILLRSFESAIATCEDLRIVTWRRIRRRRRMPGEEAKDAGLDVKIDLKRLPN